MLTTAWHPRRSVQVIWMNTLYIMRTSSCWSSAIPTALIFPVALVAAPTCAFVVLTILAGAISSSSSADNSLTKPVSSLAVLNSTSDWKFFTAKSHGSVANEETQLRKKYERNDHNGKQETYDHEGTYMAFWCLMFVKHLSSSNEIKFSVYGRDRQSDLFF